jgi:hypothetical protein
VPVVVCVGVRLWYLTTPQATLDGDEAMTGLMARRILHGHLYTYLADQHYNGALEQYPQALALAVLPDSAVTLRLVQVALAALVTALVYLVGAWMLPTRWHATLAALLFALGPFFNLWKGVRSHGAYGTAQVLGLVGLYCALRLRSRGEGEGEGDETRWLVAFGGVCGLALWASWSAAYLLLPAALWVLPSLARRPRALLGMAGAAAAGYLPALTWAVAHRALPLLGGPQPDRTPAERLGGLLSPVLRELVGVGYRDGRPGWPLPLQYGAVGLLAVAYMVAVWRRRRGLADLLTLRAAHRRPADLLLLVVPVTAVLYALSKYTWFTGEPRYLFAAYPALALGLAALVPAPGTGRRWRARVPVAAGTALLVLVGGTSVGQLVRHHGEGPRDLPGCLTAAAGALSAQGVRAVYANYWTGLPLQFYAGDRLLVGPVNGGRNKFPEARRVLDAEPHPVYAAGHVPDPMGQERDFVQVMDEAFARHGVRVHRRQLGCLVVYSDLDPVLRPWELGVGTRMPS